MLDSLTIAVTALLAGVTSYGPSHLIRLNCTKITNTNQLLIIITNYSDSNFHL